jgi:hypothetical protein
MVSVIMVVVPLTSMVCRAFSKTCKIWYVEPDDDLSLHDRLSMHDLHTYNQLDDCVVDTW